MPTPGKQCAPNTGADATNQSLLIMFSQWPMRTAAKRFKVSKMDDMKRGTIFVMGRHEERQDFVRPDLLKRLFISRAKSPVGNKFEREKNLSREEQIDAHRQHVYEEWILKGEIPQAEAQWIDARVQDLNNGIQIDLITDSRMFRHKPGAFIAKNQPHDCHGYTLRGVILWRAGLIKSSEFLEYVISSRDDEEGPRGVASS